MLLVELTQTLTWSLKKKLKRWHAAYRMIVLFVAWKGRAQKFLAYQRLATQELRLIVLFVSTMYKFLWPERVEHRSEKETEEGGTKFNAIFIVASVQFCVVLDAPSVQQSSMKSVGDRRAVVGAV